jgi:hypothetical protein
MKESEIQEYLTRLEIAIVNEYGQPVDLVFLNNLERFLREIMSKSYENGVKDAKY